MNQLEYAVNVEALQKNLATSDELSNHFGSSDIASVYMNALACRYEDQLQELIPAYQQVSQYAGQLEGLLTGPIEGLANYYLNREQIEAEYGNPVPTPQEINYGPQDFGQLPAYLPGGGVPNMAPVPGVPGMSNMMAPPNQLAQAATAASQYAQNTGVQGPMRPEFPQVMAGQGQQQMSLQQIPASERYKYIDMLSGSGGFRGMRLF